jgi:hypothetical protein
MPWQALGDDHYTYSGALAAWVAEFWQWSLTDLPHPEVGEEQGLYQASLATQFSNRAVGLWRHAFLGPPKAARLQELMQAGIGHQLTMPVVLNILDYLAENLDLDTIREWAQEARPKAAAVVAARLTEWLDLVLAMVPLETIRAVTPSAFVLTPDGRVEINLTVALPTLFGYPTAATVAEWIQAGQLRLCLPTPAIPWPASLLDAQRALLQALMERGLTAEAVGKMTLYTLQRPTDGPGPVAYLVIAGHLLAIPPGADVSQIALRPSEGDPLSGG